MNFPHGRSRHVATYLGKDEAGMILQRWDGNDWVGYKMDCKLVNETPV
jgi:hypothetical protein